jgi:hypothetical protein
MRCASFVISLLLGVTLMAAPKNLLPVQDFRNGLTGWQLKPGPADFATVEDKEEMAGQVVRLAPHDTNWGLNSAPLTVGQEIDLDHAYTASAALKNVGIEQGVFAFSVCAYDAAGKRLLQMAAHHLSTKSKPHDWLTKTLEFGRGTARALPAETHTVRLRFSFYDASGKPSGTVLVRDASVVEKELGPFPDWPASILADVGDLQVRFESRSFWTLYRIDYEKVRLCLDRFGSHYGTVANFAGTGFIGSGHTENEDEKLLELALTVDGKPCPKPADHYTCASIQLHKRSRLRDLLVDSLVTVADNRIVEDVRLRAEQPTKVNLIYHFMHPWTTQMSDYLAELPDGTQVSGTFVDDKKQKINKPVKWSAVYSQELAKGAVTVVWDVPEDLPWQTRYWDMPGRYRKHYFTTFMGAEVPTGREFRYRVVTLPFAAPAADWQAKAKALAGAAERPTE